MLETPVTLPRMFVRLHDFGALEARHGRGDDRNRARGARRGLHGGRGDGVDEVDVVRDEASRDRRESRLIALRVLAVERHFDALAVAEFVKALDEALHGVVQGFVLDDLNDADRKRFLGSGLCGGRRFVAARKQDARKEHRGEKGGETGENGGVHGDSPCCRGKEPAVRSMGFRLGGRIGINIQTKSPSA